MAIPVASPSSSFSFTSETKFRYEYDVFLSFRGEDTRRSFTEILYDALRRKGINAFIDDKKLGKGEEISPTLLKAIERSRISIIVFSTNYATSTWCLDELAHIVRCMKEKKQVVMPIFYKVDPMDVQYQRNSFEEAVAALEDRFSDDLEKVRKWRSALSEAASLSSAWLFDDGYELGFIERIVEDAYAVLPPKRCHKTDHIVGLEPRIEEIMLLLNRSDDRVCMLGIHGTGGVGKTTIAKAIYNSIFYQFEGSCFLFDVKETSNKYQGIVRLQQTLLSEILEEKRMKFGSVDEGISNIKHRLSGKKVLLVLDDVDEVEQLEQLAGSCDWFGSGSKIIITTRNKQLLIACNVKRTYEMKELNYLHSIELFCWYAFGLSQPKRRYKGMSIHVIRYVHGLPLALKLIGSNLANKSIEEWRSILKQYDEIQERTINHVLKISYDCLQDGAKRIFLDIACFFKEKKLEFVEAILEACHCGARFYIEVLVDKSLITILDHGYLYMHDLIQHMGRDIAKEEAPCDPSECSRLWYHKDVLKVLRENLGGNNIEGIVLDPPQQEEVEWSGLAFEKMNNLRILIVRNTKFSASPKYLPNSLVLLDWQEYPSMTLPRDFCPPKLICFKIYGSPFRWEEPLKLEYVTYMDFSKCEFITEVPELSRFQNLKELSFSECHNLIKVHDSVGSLRKLVELDVSKCIKLASFPHEIKMPSLEVLNLIDCQSLDYFPHIVGNMEPLMCILADGSAINELPSSIGNLPRLEVLSLTSCKSLRKLPNSLLTLHNLKGLKLGGLKLHGRKSLKKLLQENQPPIMSCSKLDRLDLHDCGLLDEDLHLPLKCFKHVKDLILSWNDFVSLPECIKECVHLMNLEVNNCKRLRDIPELPSRLGDIRAENCTSLTMESSGRLWSQAIKSNRVTISMPATAYPDWFDHRCQGGMLSFRVHGRNFPRVVIAFETGKANRNKTCYFDVFMIINGSSKMPWMQIDFPILGEGGRVLVSYTEQGHVFFSDLLGEFTEEELGGLNKFLELDWNDVEIQVTCDSDDIDIVNCGVYVDKKQTNMKNVQFKSSRTSQKRRAIASLPSEPPKKLLRKFKTTSKRNINNTKKRTRRTKPQHFHPWYRRRKMFFPMGKNPLRFVYHY
ncbi:TMV resistance protein N-like isoform X1 [Prosopis cineraria]|uniref:TMV resistance protein N-like isoform X1 n=1 Tax=Prosopis cineraria TaxID=364024 RepID=UPI0024100CD0|nr:TMV resistance protein N-like isoform X1 [Prosopis cineraria]